MNKRLMFQLHVNNIVNKTRQFTNMRISVLLFTSLVCGEINYIIII